MNMRVRFFVADDIQTLEGGKPILSGFYPDAILVLNKKDDIDQEPNPLVKMTYALPSLALMLTIIDGPPGKHAETLKIVSPNGEYLPFPSKPISFEIAPQGQQT